MRTKLAVVLCALALQACGTMAFTPAEYPLRDGLIPGFPVTGAVSISNNQPDKNPTIVYSYMGSKLSSDLNAITEVMVQQANKELDKNGKKNGGVASKTIALKVNSLVSEYIAFFWKSNMQFQATLGNGEVIDTTVPHTSGVLAQDLNGCIAEGVMTLFKDERVKAYLAQ